MAAAGRAVQRALYETLTQYPPLAAAVTGIFDYVPAGQRLPYVTVGEAVESDWSAKGFAGREHRLAVHVWSAHGGMGEAKDLLGLVDEALEHAPELLDGHRLVSLRFLSSRVFAEPQDGIRHGLAEYRARTVKG